MSTQLHETVNVTATRFYGGDNNGVSLQLTGDNGYVQLTAAELVELLPHFQTVINDELERRSKLVEAAIAENKELERTIFKDMIEVTQMATAQTVLKTASLLCLPRPEPFPKEPTL